MPGFSKSDFRTPFGVNVYLRSTRDVKTKSMMVAMATVPDRTIDGFPGQKWLKKGTVLARIIDGPFTGMVGPFQAAGTAEVQTITKAGTWTSGTYTITLLGVTTEPIAMAANAADVLTAIKAAFALEDRDDEVADLAVTGGPLSTTPLVVTFDGTEGEDVALITVDTTGIVGGGTASSAQTTQGVAGAVDGRGDTANIVGFNNTELPWQLTERDVEVAVVYEASVVQENCIVLNAAGDEIPLDNTTAAAMMNQKSLSILFP